MTIKVSLTCALFVRAEKGICISTASLWILLVYTEASLRLKDLKTSHANLSHLFAAHWCVDVMHGSTELWRFPDLKWARIEISLGRFRIFFFFYSALIEKQIFGHEVKYVPVLTIHNFKFQNFNKRLVKFKKGTNTTVHS